MAKDYASSKRPAPKASSASLSGFKWMLAGLALGLLLAGFVYLRFAGNREALPVLRGQQTGAASDENAANEIEELRKGKRRPHHGGARVVSNDVSPEKKPHFDFYTILPEMEVPVADNKPSAAPEATETAKTAAAEPTTDATPATQAKAAKDKEEAAKSTTVVEHDKPPLTVAKHANDDTDNDTDDEDELHASPPDATDSNNGVTPPDEDKDTDKMDKSSAPTQASANRGSYILQFASFKNFEDADRLKARLTLLGVEVEVQQSVNSHGDTLYRVRKGPYSVLAKAEKDRAWLHDNQIPVMVVKAEG